MTRSFLLQLCNLLLKVRDFVARAGSLRDKSFRGQYLQKYVGEFNKYKEVNHAIISCCAL